MAAEFMILATSLPVAGYPGAEILEVYRLRWQIGLADASRRWLYANLIMTLLCDDLSQVVLASFP